MSNEPTIDENIGKMALNEHQQLGMIVDKTMLGEVAVYIGLPVCDELSNWLSINPKVFPDKLGPNSLMEMAMIRREAKLAALQKKGAAQRQDTFFTVNPGESIGEALDSFLNSFPLSPKKPPNPGDFKIDSIDDPEEDVN